MGVPMGTNYAPLVADCVCFVMIETSCCLSDSHQTAIIEAFNSTSRYLDDLHN